MIIDLLVDAATTPENGFEYVDKIEDVRFYKRIKGEDRRFLVVVESINLLTPEEYNFKIESFSPIELKNDPSFEKNTDLIVLYEMSSLNELKTCEKYIFSIEENPYYFKKYVFYYSSEEVELIQDYNFSDFDKVILDRDQFRDYKNSPLKASLYSIISRFYIKLPFLEIPVDEGELRDVNEILSDSLDDEGLLEFSENFEKLANKFGDNIDGLIEAYANEQN